MADKGVPRSVVEADHRLEGVHASASLDLAKHRWHWTVDASNARCVSFTDYAAAVQRNRATIQRYANGYALYVEKLERPPGGAAYTIQDAIRQSENSTERQAFNEAIAEGSGRAVGQVARGDNRVRTNAIIAHAKDRAERRGTDPVSEARDIARHQRQTRERKGKEKADKAKAHFFRWSEIEGDLVSAQRKLVHALEVAEGAQFTDEEMEFIRVAVEKVRALLNLLDLRMAGAIDVDWDGELAKLGKT